MNYDEARDNFIQKLTARMKEYYAKRLANLPVPKIYIDKGSKFDRVVLDGNSKMVYCFIQKDNGDLLKAASWKAPAKHARGNIYNEDPLKGTTPYGCEYLIDTKCAGW